MSTSPFSSTSVIVSPAHRAGSGRPVTTSYMRERDLHRATRYTNEIGYNSRGYDYPYDSYDPYDLALAEQRELEEIRLAEYRRNEYPRTGAATILTTGAGSMRGGKTVYLSSGRPVMDRYPQLGHASGIRTVSVERPGPIIHRAPTRYTNQPGDYAFGDYPTDYDGFSHDGYRVPAGGRVRRYPTRYGNGRVFGAPGGYASGYREQVVVAPSYRTTRYH